MNMRWPGLASPGGGNLGISFRSLGRFALLAFGILIEMQVHIGAHQTRRPIGHSTDTKSFPPFDDGLGRHSPPVRHSGFALSADRSGEASAQDEHSPAASALKGERPLDRARGETADDYVPADRTGERTTDPAAWRLIWAEIKLGFCDVRGHWCGLIVVDLRALAITYCLFSDL